MRTGGEKMRYFARGLERATIPGTVASYQYLPIVKKVAAQSHRHFA
jgi:hypothetical protein